MLGFLSHAREAELKRVGNREPLKAKLKDRVLAELEETTKSVFQKGYCLWSYIHVEMGWREVNGGEGMPHTELWSLKSIY